MAEARHDSLKPAAVFTGLTLGSACLYWGLIELAQRGALPFAMTQFDFSLQSNSIPGVALAFLLRLFGPALAAVLTIALCYGRPTLNEWVASLLRWRIPGWLYLLAFLGSLGVSAVIVAVGIPLGLLHFEPTAVHVVKFLLFFFPMLLFDGPLGEEPGWRGFLLPELLKRVPPLQAGLLVGVVWYLWHMPLYLADGRAINPAGYFVNVVSLSVVFTWFYLRSGRSTLMTMFLHTSSNYALFLMLKSFSYPGGIETLQLIYDGLVVVAALAATWDLRRRYSD